MLKKWLLAAVLVQATRARECNATLVFGLGLPKTGTRSLQMFFRKLGSDMVAVLEMKSVLISDV